MVSGSVSVTSLATTLCTIRLSFGNGSCSLYPRILRTGSYHVAATYRTSTDFKSSVSPDKALTVAN
jgi:hypothetical protein